MLKISYPYAISHLVKLLTILLFINLFIFESLTYALGNTCYTHLVVQMWKLHWKCDLKLLLSDFEIYLLHILMRTRENCTENITWSCTVRLWFSLNWSIVLADVPSVFRYVKQPCTKFTYVSRANLHNKSSSIDVFNLYWTLNALNLTVIFFQAIELMVVDALLKSND